MFNISLGFGWIIAIILISSHENNNFFLSVIIYIVVVLIISMIIELNDLIKTINNNNNEYEKRIINQLNEINIEKEKMSTLYNQKLHEIELEKINLRKIYDDEKSKLINQYNILLKNLNNEKEQFNKIVSEEKIYKPYLAQMLANYNAELDSLKAKILETKKNPAIKAAKELREISRNKTILKKTLKIKEHQLIVYENLFPWLEEFKEIPEKEINEIINKDISEGYDRVKKILSPEEYEKLPDVKKYQLWLDRYKAKKNKSNWEIGIEFERYVRYKYESEGYKILYNGASEGLEDLGRDLIATKGEEILIIQCKNWGKVKTIHEKHIFQLHGTMVLKSIEDPNKKISGVFICTTNLSETAKAVASHLNIKVLENFEYDKNYPCIKCNISKRDGSRIYHLPFDQQYDTVDIDLTRGEFYVQTVLEAEQLGFRKAMKHSFFE